MTQPLETSGGDWSLELDPPILLPSRPVIARIGYVADTDHEAREVRAVLRAEETYQYRRTETSGKTTRTVTRTGHDEVVRLEAALSGPTAFRRGEETRWEVAFDVPPLGPATFEGSDVLRCDWTLEVSCDRAWRGDDRMVAPVRVAQPMALLRAGVVATGQYGLFEDAPVNVDAYPAQIRIDPVPLSVAHPFSGELRIETAEPIEVQEVRLELRVHARCTERRGLEDELLIATGRLDTPTARSGAPSPRTRSGPKLPARGPHRSTCGTATRGPGSTSSWRSPGAPTSTTSAMWPWPRPPSCNAGRAPADVKQVGPMPGGLVGRRATWIYLHPVQDRLGTLPFVTPASR